MKYALLIHWDEKGGSVDQEHNRELIRQCYLHTKEMAAEGVFLHGSPLSLTPTAKTLRIRNGERMVSDGPYAETKEQFGGYQLLECESREQAIEKTREVLAVQQNTAGGVELHELDEDAV